MVIAMALALLFGVLFYGAVDPDVAAPMYFFGLLATALWAGKLLFSSASTWKSSPMHWPVLAFGVYAIIRYFSSPVEYDARIELLHVALCGLAYFTACQFYHPSHRTILLVTLLLLVVFESSYALWQLSTKSDVVLFWRRPEAFTRRGGGSFINPNNLAGFLELAFGLVLVRGLLMHRNKGSVEAFAVRRMVIIYVALMALMGIGISLSRGGWLATVVGLAILAVWGDWRARMHWGRFAGVAVGIILLGLIAWKIAPYRVARALTIVDKDGGVSVGFADKTLNSRLFLWKSTLSIIRENPVFGTGVASWQWMHPKYRNPQVRTHTDYAHNDYLNLLSDYGVVGFGLMLWVFVAFFRQAVKTSDARLPSEERSWTVGAVVGVTAVLVHSILDFNLHIPGNAFALAVVMGSTAAIADPDGRFPRAPLPGWARTVLGCSLLAICGLLGWQFSKAALASRYNRLGIDARSLHRDDPDIAYEYFRQAIEWDPRFPTPHWQMGDLVRSEAQWRRGEDKKPERVRLARQGIESFAVALRLNPLNAEVLLRAAGADELAGDDAEALKKYLRAVALDPGSAINHLKLAQFYRDHDKPALALEHYLTTSRLNGWSDPVIDLNIIELQELLKKGTP